MAKFSATVLLLVCALAVSAQAQETAPFAKFCGEQRTTCLSTCEDKIKEFVCNDITGITTSPCLCEDGETAAAVDPPSPPAPPATEDTPETDATGDAGKKPVTMRPPAPDVPNPIDSPASPDAGTVAANATDAATNAADQAAAAVEAASSAVRTTGSIAVGLIAAAMLF